MIELALVMLVVVVSGSLAAGMLTGDVMMVISSFIFFSVLFGALFFFAYTASVDQVEFLNSRGVEAELGGKGCEIVGSPQINCREVVDVLRDREISRIVNISGGGA